MTLFNDIFTDDAFSFVSLTEGVQNLPYVESRLGQLGLFTDIEEGVETDTVVIDETEGQLQILTTRARGSDPEKAKKEKKAKSRAIQIPHLQFEDRVMASSLLGKRMPGMNQLQTVASKINSRFQFMMNNVVAPTFETHRLNALRGILLDGDGSTVIHDYFSFFGKSQINVNIPFSNGSTNVRETAVDIIRQIEDELGGLSFTGARALCDRTFFDKLTAHPKVRDTFLNQQESQGRILRSDLRRGFEFGGIFWEEYRGMRNLPNNLGRIADNQAIVFPEGVPGMLRTYYAPAEFLETVDELGQPMYAKVAPDWKYNRWVDQLIETNPLFINVRPRSTLKLTAT